MEIIKTEPTGSNIALNPIIRITTNEQVDPVSLTKLTCLMWDIYGQRVERIINYDSNKSEIKIYPIGLLQKNTLYTVMIKGVDGVDSDAPLAIKNLEGTYLEYSKSFDFTTGESIDETYPFVTESVETGFNQHIEGAIATRSLVTSEIGEPTIYIESAAALNYSGIPTSHDEGGAVFLEGVYNPNTLPVKTDDFLEVVDYYPKIVDFKQDQESFIVYFNDTLEAWIRNTYGMSIYGESYYEDFEKTIKYYIRLKNYVPYTNSFTIPGEYSNVEYDVDYLADLNAVRFTITNPTGWNAELGLAQPNILDWNTVYTFNVIKDLAGLTTQNLQTPFSVTYTSNFYPLYCDILTIRENNAYLDLQDYDDNLLKLMIFRSSLEADEIIAAYDTKLTPLVIMARRNFVCCLTQLKLLNSTITKEIGLLGTSEALGDYSYKAGYSNVGIKPIIDDLEECVLLNKSILINGSLHPDPNYAIRDKNNIRRPQKYRWVWGGKTHGNF